MVFLSPESSIHFLIGETKYAPSKIIIFSQNIKKVLAILVN